MSAAELRLRELTKTKIVNQNSNVGGAKIKGEKTQLKLVDTPSWENRVGAIVAAATTTTMTMTSGALGYRCSILQIHTHIL